VPYKALKGLIRPFRGGLIRPLRAFQGPSGLYKALKGLTRPSRALQGS
jgi:hypothetical protein